jgi:TonB family protein
MDIAENKNKITAMVLTISVHVLLILLFVFIVFITPIPTFKINSIPEQVPIIASDNGESIYSDLNTEEIKQDLVEPQPSQSVKVVATSALITDKTETSTFLPTNPNNKNSMIVDKTEEQKENHNLKNLLQKLQDTRTTKIKEENNGERSIGGKEVNRQHKDGVESTIETDKNFIHLKGRKLIKKPNQPANSQEQGTVIVEIIVDETGKVIRAIPMLKGSSTVSSNLYTKASQAALSAKFDPSPEGIKEQRGTYRFDFVLE